MKRRNFLVSIFSVPVAAVAVKLLPQASAWREIVKSEVMTSKSLVKSNDTSFMSDYDVLTKIFKYSPKLAREVIAKQKGC